MIKRAGGQRLEAKLVRGELGRFAEADLIGHDDAVAFSRKRCDGRRPVSSRKVLPVQEHDRAPVGLRGGDIHVSHAQLLTLRVGLEEPDGVRVLIVS
jgi:hypothetical protein